MECRACSELVGLLGCLGLMSRSSLTCPAAPCPVSDIPSLTMSKEDVGLKTAWPHDMGNILAPLNIRCRCMICNQNEPIILRTTHIPFCKRIELLACFVSSGFRLSPRRRRVPLEGNKFDYPCVEFRGLGFWVYGLQVWGVYLEVRGHISNYECSYNPSTKSLSPTRWI